MGRMSIAIASTRQQTTDSKGLKGRLVSAVSGSLKH